MSEKSLGMLSCRILISQTHSHKVWDTGAKVSTGSDFA